MFFDKKVGAAICHPHSFQYYTTYSLCNTSRAQHLCEDMLLKERRGRRSDKSPHQPTAGASLFPTIYCKKAERHMGQPLRKKQHGDENNDGHGTPCPYGNSRKSNKKTTPEAPRF
jgi:hypothetical protein